MANTEKLNIIREVVATTPDANWDMWDWKCGTAGCAIGNAAPLIGLELRNCGGKLVPYQSGEYEFGAVARCLAISEDHAAQMFSPYEYNRNTYRAPISRETVIERIDEFIKHYSEIK